MKSKIILIVIAFSLIGFIFKSSIINFLKKDIDGCTDFLAVNYDPNATIDDGSCSLEKRLSAELFKEIEVLRNSDWDINEYNNLEFEIFTYFKSIGQKGSGQERFL